MIEALSVILQVASYKLRKKRIFKMAPIHHHFELMGWSESKIIVRFWIAVADICSVRTDHVEAAIISRTKTSSDARPINTASSHDLDFDSVAIRGREVRLYESVSRLDLNKKRVLVVGLGRSGVASALFLKSHGARVTVLTPNRRPVAGRNSRFAGPGHRG